MDWKPETDITMDYAVHDHQDERTTAVITQLTELLNLVSNHLGSPIDFTDKPVTKKPTSKKVPMKGSNETDKTTLSNKTIPGLAISQAKPKVTKANPLNNKSRDFTGSTISKEHPDEEPDSEQDFKPAQPEGEVEEKLMPQALAGASMLYEEAIDQSEERKSVMSALTTSEGKQLLSVLTEAANLLRKFLSTTRVSNQQIMKPNDMKPDPTANMRM